jgi:hypothetical protein
MKNKRIILMLLSLLFISTINAQNNALSGNWKATNGTIMSFKGTQVSVAGDTYTYEVEDQYLSMYNQQGDVLTYTYQINGNQLYLYLEGAGTYILTKVGQQGYSNRTNRGSGVNNGKLYGNWTANNGNVMNFKTNTVNVGGDTYTYQVSGDQLTMYNNAGESLTYTYNIQGNQLYLYLDGSGTFVLTRGGNNATNQVYNQNIGQTNNSVGGVGANRIYGTFCSYSSSGYSGSSSYSTTTRVYFDGRGHYQYGSQSSYSGNGDGYSGGSGGSGGTYQVVGNQGVILTANDGSVYKVAIHFVQDSGEITELKYDGVVYAKSLCD